MCYNIKRAFTLTELLISLTIIGVIAVVTVPVVFSKMNEKAQISALKTNYASMNTAIKSLMVDERASFIPKTSLYRASETDSLADSAGSFLKRYFKVTKDCETSTSGCFASNYKTRTGSALSLPSDGTFYCVGLSTGASMCIKPNTDKYPAAVLVDVNGPTKPNVEGKDLFNYFIYGDTTVGILDVENSKDTLTDIANVGIIIGTDDDRSVKEDTTIDFNNLVYIPEPEDTPEESGDETGTGSGSNP